MNGRFPHGRDKVLHGNFGYLERDEIIFRIVQVVVETGLSVNTRLNLHHVSRMKILPVLFCSYSETYSLALTIGVGDKLANIACARNVHAQYARINANGRGLSSTCLYTTRLLFHVIITRHVFAEGRTLGRTNRYVHWCEGSRL